MVIYLKVSKLPETYDISEGKQREPCSSSFTFLQGGGGGGGGGDCDFAWNRNRYLMFLLFLHHLYSDAFIYGWLHFKEKRPHALLMIKNFKLPEWCIGEQGYSSSLTEEKKKCNSGFLRLPRVGIVQGWSWEPVRNAGSQACPRPMASETLWMRPAVYILISCPGDLDVVKVQEPLS